MPPIPATLVNPGLFERLRSSSLKQLLEHTRRPVLVVNPDGPGGSRERTPTAMAA